MTILTLRIGRRFVR